MLEWFLTDSTYWIRNCFTDAMPDGKQCRLRSNCFLRSDQGLHCFLWHFCSYILDTAKPILSGHPWEEQKVPAYDR